MGTDRNLSRGNRENSSRDPLVDKLAKEIESNLNNNQFGVDSLAYALGMSRSSLHRKLQKAVGISTSQFIREYRLKRALEILRQEDITASEVAYQVGFSSATYFNTCFHKFYGYTPGEVKSRMVNEIEEDNEPYLPEIRNAHHTDPKNSRTKKRGVKKFILWAILFVAVVSTAFFIYRANSKENEGTLVVEKTTNEKSIAVLPFKNWTGSPDMEYISDGMTDAVISRLAKIGDMDMVIPFTSTLQFKETKKTVKEIATELGVETILQGNLQISGNQIKIKLQLINGKTNNHLWSEEYTRDWKSDEIFKIQTDVVEGIASQMNVVIAKDELVDIQKEPTKNKLAYSYYLQAEFQRNKANELTYLNAIALYEKAIEIDSNFVEAYVSMANIYSFGGLVWGIYNEQEAWSNAKLLLKKAFEIDPSNREVEEELYTGYFYFDWNYEVVEEYYQDILKNSFYDKTPAINFDYAIKTGRYKEAIKAIEEHILIDPSIGNFFIFKAEALLFLGRSDEASGLINSMDRLYSDNWFYLRESTKLHFYLGEYKKSKIGLNKLLTQFPDYPPILMWLNTVYAHLDGNSEDEAKYLNELLDKYNAGSSGSPAWFMAMYYCTIEDYELVFDWLQKSYDRHEVEMTWLREEPLLAPLRNDPRYKELYDKVGFSSIGIPIKVSSKNLSS